MSLIIPVDILYFYKYAPKGPIILTKLMTYYSQNYAGIIRTHLFHLFCDILVHKQLQTGSLEV